VERVAIDGHTDDQGVPAANQRLSLARAEAVKAYLVVAGVPPERLEARGFGQARPLTSNATPAGREQNRRVEFIILGQ
jgi:outer membrane protein OmpA-like peptidoglycan-associated protein